MYTSDKGKDIAMINFNIPPYVDKAADYILECVRDQKICGDGSYTKKCSEWIEQHTGTAKCLLTTSCTHAIELTALLADIRPGDEVIMPSYTFASTANAFVLRGGVPVFVDIHPDTMNIDENLIEAAITERTKVLPRYIMLEWVVKWIQLWKWRKNTTFW